MAGRLKPSRADPGPAAFLAREGSMRRLAFGVLVWALLPLAARAAPAPVAYPEGYSQQEFGGHRFELIRPPTPAGGGKLGVILVHAQRAGTKKALEALKDKVRTLEYRDESAGVGGEYFAFWLEAMEGRSTPGVDLSLPWTYVATPAAWDEARKAAGKGAVVYLFSAADAGKPESRLLHTEVLLDADVREAGRALLAATMDVGVHPDLLAALHVAKTPALVVVDAAGKEVGHFEAKFSAPAVVKALRDAKGN